jgi:hypothetical protein
MSEKPLYKVGKNHLYSVKYKLLDISHEIKPFRNLQ